MEEIAQVYGRALFEVAREHGQLDEIREELGQFTDALDESRELTLFLFSPYFSTEEKQAGLANAVSGANEELMNFLSLLIENHRTPAIFRIRREYDALWEKENQQLPVRVTSAIELDRATVKGIGDRIGESTGRQVNLTTSVEPDILGGIVVQVGNSILDASIRNRLEQLRKQVARG